MKSLRLSLFIICILFANSLVAQKTNDLNDSIQWVDVEEAYNNNEEGKNYFVFVYIDDCPFCQETKETLLVDKKFIQAINENFIPIRLDAKSFETVEIENTELEFDSESGYHSLPIILLEGEMAFPSFVYLNSDFQLITRVKGAQSNTKDFSIYSEYIGTNKHTEIAWKDYLSSVNSEETIQETEK